MVFTICDFESLEKKHAYVTTTVTCHGHQWRLKIHPWGGTEEGKKDGWVSFFLFLVDPVQEPVKVDLTFRGGSHQQKGLRCKFSAEQSGWGCPTFIKRTSAIAKLDHAGSLIIHVDMSCWLKSKPIWRPENVLQRKFRSLWDSDKGKDVSFRVGCGDVHHIVLAHSSVLSIQCPDLYDIVSESGNNDDIEIENTDADLFALLVHHMYHETLPGLDLEKDGFELLKLANRFGYSDLKIDIEADLVGSSLLTAETAADFLLFADANCCALLKEAAMDIVVSNYAQVVKSNGWKSLKESSTLLVEVCEQLSKAPTSEDGNSVSALRKKCADMGLDVDGTREMLIERCRI